VLDEFGVVSAIETLVSQHHVPGGPTIRFVCRGRCRRLTPSLESGIYRIVQEILTNACRHSGSRRIRVELACNGRNVRVVVQDWGVGFVPDRTEASYSGLKDVRERARLLGGQAVIETALGRGTRVAVRLPLVALPSQCRLTVPHPR
jgi:signal transduction histidine kinase